MKTSNNKIGEFLLAKANAIGDWLVKHARIVMPVVLLLCVTVTVIVSVNANKREAEIKEDVEANVTVDETADAEYVVPLVPLQENTVPEITELINTYYTAMVNGDTETIAQLKDGLEESEAIRIKELSKYTESYPTLNIYTKVGPTENSYLVYVESTLMFKDFADKPLAGMRAYYVRADENGVYHIIENGKLSDQEEDYMRKVNLQDDVVDLNNKVTVEYNDMVASDVELAQFLLDMNTEVEKNVGAVLAQAQEEAEGEEGAETEEGAAEEQEPETLTVVTKVRATDVVNIRTSDSETADKLGKAAIGDEFTLIEKIGNGWSKIEYEGSEAYIKSEYLEDIETTEVAAGNGEESEEEAEESTEPADAANVASNGTVRVLETVRIRSSASETSEKLGTAYAGEKLELVMKQADGWTKIKYNGKIAYVKSEYVE
ncbi:MAG: SH3 domain-containing protein [Roseburia sp.]|nr:SH3 domain-containing protein [Roseburia sp.]